MFGMIDRLFDRSRDVTLLLARLALSAIFIPSGFLKLLHLETFARSLAARGVPGGTAMALLAAGVELFGGLAVALGFRVRWSALLMLAFTVVAALVSHRFWELDDGQRAMQHVQFMKNLAIAGGFLALSAAGAGRFRIDR
jgi:putative oxidoreductase